MASTTEIEELVVAKAGIWVGRVITAGALVAWCGWLTWSLTAFAPDVIGIAALAAHFVAFSAALVVTAGLWIPRGTGRYARTRGRRTPMPVLAADALGLDRSFVELGDRTGSDDTGEIAWARRGMAVLGAGAAGSGPDPGVRARAAAWSVVSTDGLRRMIVLGLLVAVLFTGRAPSSRPPVDVVLLLVVALSGVSLGHWLLSGGRIRPGARSVWSMASVGAGLGNGRSRSGLPVRWMTTMATMVVLNLAVGLRGLSDRWTHGLGPMAHDARVVAMTIAIGHVALGLLALRTMPRPDLGFYGATQRLEETSTRRLALGGTMAVAVLGFVLGVLPVESAS